MSEAKEEDKIGELAKFVDENCQPTSLKDIFSVFPQAFFVLILVMIVLVIAFSTIPLILFLQWTPVIISFLAIIVAFYSFLMASRKYVNKRLAAREAKRILSLMKDKDNEVTCLLPPLVALKLENYHIIKLQVLYTQNKELFSANNLMENYYLP